MVKLAKRQSRHSKLKSILLEKIYNSTVNTLLPGEVKLADEFGVCRATVNKAMVELEQEGYVIRRAGKGTFVAPRDKTIVTGSNNSPRTKGDVIIAYPDFFSYAQWHCVHLAEMEALKNNMNLINLKLNENSNLESLEDILASSDNISGAILFGIVDKTLTNSLLKRLDCYNVPLVVNTDNQTVNTCKNVFFISGDHKKSGYLKMDYLLRNGHRKIGFIQNEPASEAGVQHIKGIKQALYDNGIRWKDLIKSDVKARRWEDPVQAGYDITKDILAKHDITAVLVETVSGAFGCLRALYEFGLKCPDDISIVTALELFGLEKMTCPALSTVVSPHDKLIKWMFDIIVNKGNVSSNSFIIDSVLIERESVKNLHNISSKL